MIPEGDRALDDLTFDLVQKASTLAASLPGDIQEEIGRLVRSMNCYYSNFLEGHQTHPREIERALSNEFSGDISHRNLQAEARAHIEVQKAIDLGVGVPPDWPASDVFVRWLHREFCSRLPPDLLRIETVDTKRLVDLVPGEYRKGSVDVGRHVAPPAEALPELMARFTEAYRAERLSKTQRLLSAATSHHRFAWIHPFADGNGRVARLMSHAMLLRLGIGSSLWSVSRGLARNADRYKSLLASADGPRKDDFDGRARCRLERSKISRDSFLRSALIRLISCRNCFSRAKF